MPSTTPPPTTPPAPPPDHSPTEPPRQTGGAVGKVIGAIFAYWLVSWILVPVAIVLLLHYFVFSAFHVVGTSMIPTLQDSNYLIVSKVEHTEASLLGKPYIPHREQIIVFHYPKDPVLDFVKRVIALPGDRIVINNCKVTIYNSQHPGGFNPDAVHPTEGSCTEGSVDEVIPPNNVYVLGENRTPGGSADSRDWGLLPSSDIIGNAVLRLYPASELHIF